MSRRPNYPWIDIRPCPAQGSGRAQGLGGAQGPALVGCGLAMVLLAQFNPATPIAASFGLIGWGSALSIAQRSVGVAPGRRLALVVTVYAALVGLAIAAELDLALRSASTARRLLVAIDAWAALALLITLVRWTFGRLIDPCRPER